MSKRMVFLTPIAAVMLALAASAPVWAAPEATGSGGIADPVMGTVIDSVGNDLFSTTDLSSLLDPTSANGTQHYGPYTSGSPDSGTCGNDWAEDTFDRHFTVRQDGPGTFTIVEQFKDGSFVTSTGPSPAACDPTYTNHGQLIRGGVTGSMHGYFIINNVGAQTSTSPYCDAANSTNADCTTATFVNTHFAPCYPVTCTVTTFFDHYAAGAQDLIYNEWKNASTDRGGNSGDIASG